MKVRRRPRLGEDFLRRVKLRPPAKGTKLNHYQKKVVIQPTVGALSERREPLNQQPAVRHRYDKTQQTAYQGEVQI